MSSALSDDVMETIHTVLAEKEREGIDPDDLMARFSIVETLRDASQPIYRGLRQGLPDLIRYIRGGDEAIADALDAVWGPPDRLFRATSYLSYEMAQTVLRDVPPKRGPKLVALLGLHGRSPRTAAEVRLLAMNGFEAGARARWRSLHELIVVAFVLHEADEAIAQRYLDYAMIEVRDDLKHFSGHAEALGESPPSDADLRIAEQLAADVIVRHGDEIQWSNGWAKPLFPDKGRDRRVSFAELEELAGLSHMRPYYRLGNHHIHAGSWAAHLNTAQGPEEAPKITIGATVLADIGAVCHGALIAMHQVTTVLIVEAFDGLETPNHFAELIIGMKCLENFAEDAGQLYESASVRAFEREWITAAMTAGPPVSFVGEADDDDQGAHGHPGS